MKRIWKTTTPSKKASRKDEAVSPVIATILMVAITVVLAAVLYVMVMGMVDDPGGETVPLALSGSGRTTTSFTMLVASAPNGAMVEGTQFSFTHNHQVGTITNATVYSGSGIPTAWYNGTFWEYSGTDADHLEFDSGMKIVVYAPEISDGDGLVISSSEGNFQATQITI